MQCGGPCGGIALQQGVIKLKLSKKQITQIKNWAEKGNARHYEKPYWRLYTMLLRRARKAGLPVSLTYKQFLTFVENEGCHYCGATLRWVRHGDSATAVNIDRKNNKFGCNMSRGNRFTYEEWVEMTKVIKNKA